MSSVEQGFGAAHQGGAKSVSQVKGVLRSGAHLRLPAGCREGPTKEQWYLPAFLALERAALTPPVRTFKLVSSFLPICPWHSVSCHSALEPEQVSLRVSESSHGP